jgi:predicted O-linked N-acetylglucosamine transferase (SPINDLY family)
MTMLVAVFFIVINTSFAVAVFGQGVEFYLNQAIEFAQNGRLNEALPLFVKAAESAPDDSTVQFNAGFAHMQFGDLKGSLDYFQRTLEIQPDFREAHIKAASVLRDMNRPLEVAMHLRKAIELEPGNPNAYMYLGDTLNNLKQWKEAIQVYKKAVTIMDPKFKTDKALPPIHPSQKSLAASAHLGLGDALSNMKQSYLARRHYKRGSLFDPSDGELLASLWFSGMELNEWSTNPDLPSYLAKTTAQRVVASGGPSPLSPYRLLFLELDPLQELLFAANWGKRFVDEALALKKARASENIIGSLSVLPPIIKGGLRVGYVSRRFEQYPGTQLMLGIFQNHPPKVECYVYAHGQDDGSSERKILGISSTKFADISSLTLEPPDYDHIAADSLDILVDYDGMHDFNNVRTIASLPAEGPITATWLGFAGSCGLGKRNSSNIQGAGVLDYLFADRIIVPPSDATGYTESIVYLPSTYQPQDELQNDVAKALGLVSTSRLELATKTERETTSITSLETIFANIRIEQRNLIGISNETIVLACINRNNKFTPESFDDWMSILKRTAHQHTVLWLQAPKEGKKSQPETAQDKLRNEAAARGVNPSRIIFADQADRLEYFKRLACVDLFLDTRPYGAHTVAADALWAHTPVLTLPGSSFASRVPESLYNAATQSKDPVVGASARAAQSVLVASSRLEFVDTAVFLCNEFQSSKNRQEDSEDLPSFLDYIRQRIARGISPPWAHIQAAASSTGTHQAADQSAPVLFNSKRFTNELTRAYEAMSEIKSSSNFTPASPMPHIFFELAEARPFPTSHI